MWCVTPASPDPVRMLLHDVRRDPAYTQRRVHTRVRVYAPRAAFAHMRIDAAVGAYTHHAGSRTPGGVYAHRWVRIHARLDRWNLDVYTQRQRVRVFLGIGRGIRRWVRIRASVPGAYLRSGYRLGKFRLEYVEGLER
jgi:hypothetical protein